MKKIFKNEKQKMWLSFKRYKQKMGLIDQKVKSI